MEAIRSNPMIIGGGVMIILIIIIVIFFTMQSTPQTPDLIRYFGNNGTVDGNLYCKGSWGGTPGVDKNLTCYNSINNETNESFACNILPLSRIGGKLGNFSANCYDPKKKK